MNGFYWPLWPVPPFLPLLYSLGMSSKYFVRNGGVVASFSGINISLLNELPVIINTSSLTMLRIEVVLIFCFHIGLLEVVADRRFCMENKNLGYHILSLLSIQILVLEMRTNKKSLSNSFYMDFLVT